jgi:hypothetical protein
MTLVPPLRELRSHVVTSVSRLLVGARHIVGFGIVGSMSVLWPLDDQKAVSDIDMVFETDGSSDAIGEVESLCKEVIQSAPPPIRSRLSGAIARGSVRLFADMQILPRLFLHVRVLEPNHQLSALYRYSWSKYPPLWGRSKWLGIPAPVPDLRDVLLARGGVLNCIEALAAQRLSFEVPDRSFPDRYLWSSTSISLDADWKSGCDFSIYTILRSTDNYLRATGEEIELQSSARMSQLVKSRLPVELWRQYTTSVRWKRRLQEGLWPNHRRDWNKVWRIALNYLTSLKTLIEGRAENRGFLPALDNKQDGAHVDGNSGYSAFE